MGESGEIGSRLGKLTSDQASRSVCGHLDLNVVQGLSGAVASAPYGIPFCGLLSCSRCVQTAVIKTAVVFCGHNALIDTAVKNIPVEIVESLLCRPLKNCMPTSVQSITMLPNKSKTKQNEI